MKSSIWITLLQLCYFFPKRKPEGKLQAKHISCYKERSCTIFLFEFNGFFLKNLLRSKSYHVTRETIFSNYFLNIPCTIFKIKRNLSFFVSNQGIAIKKHLHPHQWRYQKPWFNLALSMKTPETNSKNKCVLCASFIRQFSCRIVELG